MVRSAWGLRMVSLQLCIGVLSMACSSKPREADGKEEVERQIAHSSRGLIRLVKFAKTNGKQGEVSGVKVYEMQYEAEIEFLGEALWGGAAHLLGGSMTFDAHPYTGSLADLGAGPGRTVVHKGERRRVNGALTFEKWESGWVVSGGAPAASSVPDTPGHSDPDQEPPPRAASLEAEQPEGCEVVNNSILYTLCSLAIAEAEFYAKSGEYTGSLSELRGPNDAPFDFPPHGWSAPSIVLTAGGWGATTEGWMKRDVLEDSVFEATCAIFIGSTRVAPADEEAVPKCIRGAATPAATQRLTAQIRASEAKQRAEDESIAVLRAPFAARLRPWAEKVIELERAYYTRNGAYTEDLSALGFSVWDGPCTSEGWSRPCWLVSRSDTTLASVWFPGLSRKQVLGWVHQLAVRREGEAHLALVARSGAFCNFSLGFEQSQEDQDFWATWGRGVPQCDR